MKKPSLIILLLVLALAVLTLQFLGPDSGLGPDAPPPAEEIDANGAALVVPDVAVRDLDGRVAWRGDVDLAPELQRIAAGERDPHRNDGGVFQNREGLLPDRPRGHYREYVVRTPGISHAGPQRLVIGADGEVYYTHDHYQSFRRIR
ncbi:ribonuclease domain-containing protein [Thioalkalivibrio sp.]|uniref:ribonuclease domain-containing protein n=1 Tax=Thioalkalivibrio sp. TaxID=2093813 RepID=UPI0035662919